MIRSSAAQPDKLHWSFVASIILLASFALMAPAMLQGAGWGDSFVFNMVWLQDFPAALEQGQFPPRWMDDAFSGMGAPSFYFYPPLFFYAAVFVQKAVGTIDPLITAAWTVFAFQVLSGLCMYAWVRRQATDRVALVAALAYVFAPYHLLDYVARHSFGELAAYPTLPLFFLALEKAKESKTWIWALGAAYALTIYAHIAIALIVTMIGLPIYGLTRLAETSQAERGKLIACWLAGGVLGLLLASSYLLPARLLQKHSLMHVMWIPDSDFVPYSWTLLNNHLWPSDGPVRAFAISMAWLVFAYTAAGAAAALTTLGLKTQAARHTRAWAAVLAVILALYAFPGVWKGVAGLLLSKIQFPFRMFILAEFAAITAVALAWSSGRRLRLALLLIPAALCFVSPVKNHLTPALKHSREQRGDYWNEKVKRQIERHRAPDEHLPLGYADTIPQDFSLLDGYDALPLIRMENDKARILSHTVFPDRSIAVEIDTSEPARVILKRFYFVTWMADLVRPGADQPIKVEPYGPARLVSFQASPGRHVYRIRVGRTPLIKFSDAVSLLAGAGCVTLIGMQAFARRRKIRPV